MTQKQKRAYAALARWMIPPASSWRRKSVVGLAHSGLLAPMGGLATITVLSLVASLLALSFPQLNTPLIATEAILLVGALALVALLLHRVRSQLLEPLAHMRNWALRMRGGNLAARIPEPAGGEFAELARDINNLGESLATLTREMDQQVRKQTERIAQKSHSLEILYDVAASINISRDLDDLLTRFLHTLKEVVNAEAASVRLLNDEGELRMVASIGIAAEVVERELLVPVQRCRCGAAVLQGLIQCQNAHTCGDLIQHPLFRGDGLEMIAVPLHHRGKNLGVYNLFVRQQGLVEREDIKGLFTSIGQHLGTAIEKTRLEHDTRRLALMEERTLLAHELHDSLAQTLASLRFQVQILDGDLDGANPAAAHADVKNIKTGLDKANTELRQLLAHFRTPMDERGVIPAIADMVKRLEVETGISTFFQDETNGLALPASYEVQVLHIVQEALSNIRKHSKAQNARVLLRCDAQGMCRVMVEDDGQGMTTPYCSTQPGEHIGLSIMRERVARLKGNLSVETEPDEGTRIELTFRSPSPPTRTSTIPAELRRVSKVEIRQ